MNFNKIQMHDRKSSVNWAVGRVLVYKQILKNKDFLLYFTSWSLVVVYVVICKTLVILKYII